MKTIPESSSPNPGEITSLRVLGARLTWIAVGPLALLGIAGGIVKASSGWLTGLDAAFGVVLLLTLLGRWVEYRSGTATTLTGEPATPEQFRRYVARMPVLAAAVWVAANILGNHFLK